MLHSLLFSFRGREEVQRRSKQLHLRQREKEEWMFGGRWGVKVQ